MENLGFIMTRHIRDNISSNYWIENYNCIRKYYPDNFIVIIDDNSDSTYISTINMTNCIIIKSEFPGAGEILPYYYFYNVGTKYFNKAVILHDSTFIQKYIDFSSIENCNFIWHFKHNWDLDKKTVNFISLTELCEKNEIINFYLQKENWSGCFGVQSVITYDFLCKLQERFNIISLVEIIKNREQRCMVERIFAVLCYMLDLETRSLYGIIHDYLPWGLKYQKYILSEKFASKDIIKVWSGR